MKQLDVVHTTTIIKFQKLSSICIKCNINQEFQQIKKTYTLTIKCNINSKFTLTYQ